ncbi:MAG: cytidine deaminase [Opitutales bacterium]|nr:cytidine deaminase [Opitutales bacterium]
MITVVGWSELAREDQDLLVAARAASQKAFAPYSHFKVGAAVRCGDGRIVDGANYESASYGLTVCAERVAIFRANMEGEHRNISAVAIYASGKTLKADDIPVSPCGACRQILAEVAARNDCPDMRVMSANARFDRFLIATVSDLLPQAFV